MTRFDLVMRCFGAEIVAAINEAGITTPNQVGTGWPNDTDLEQILAAGQMQTTIYPDKAGSKNNASRFFPRWGTLRKSVTPLIATVAGNVVTFSGTIVPGLNVHAFVGQPLEDAYIQTTAGMTLDAVAQAMASALNDLGGGIDASVSGEAVTVLGTPTLACTIGTVTTLSREVMRNIVPVQVHFWCADIDTRDAASEAVNAAVGTVATPRLWLPDGSAVKCHQVTGLPLHTDGKLMDYECFEALIDYTLEYGVLQHQQAYEIAAIRSTLEAASTSVTVIGD